MAGGVAANSTLICANSTCKTGPLNREPREIHERISLENQRIALQRRESASQPITMARLSLGGLRSDVNPKEKRHAFMLNFYQLQTAVTAAKWQFAIIRKKYPELKGYLVLSLPGGQTGVDSSPIQILNEFPKLITDEKARATARNLLEQLEAKDLKEPEKARLEQRLAQVARQFKYDETCQVEIRFEQLNYSLIWKLQTDELVGRIASKDSPLQITMLEARAIFSLSLSFSSFSSHSLIRTSNGRPSAFISASNSAFTSERLRPICWSI